jgi:hypothetical protein
MEANGRWLHGAAGAQQALVGGDPRANENTLLTGVHTLFARHHNLLVQSMQAGRRVATPLPVSPSLESSCRSFVAESRARVDH